MTGAEAHIAGIPDPRRKVEAERLDSIFRAETGFAPKLWSGRMIGYGTYDYTYESGRSGTWFATGFSVSDRQATIYILPGYGNFGVILARLGKHRKGRACIYLTRLENANEGALRDLIRAGLDDLSAQYPVRPT